jgi:U4/U6 small nuclear ribonucleoprotein PRP4
MQFRKEITPLSFQRAHDRLLTWQKIREDDNLQIEENLSVYRLYQHHKEVVVNLSQYGDERPLSTVRYSPNGEFLASASLSPLIKTWNASTLSNCHTLRGHSDRVTGLAWKQFNAGDAHLLGSSSADGTAIIWNHPSVPGIENEMEVENTSSSSSGASLKLKLKDHGAIVSSLDFHPFHHSVVGTSCHDNSWRLFDISTGQELLLQDGHTKECTSICFHPDGSLVFTTDAGGVGLLWDLRSGQMIQGFAGHIKKINHSCFHPTLGFQVATSSVDNTVKIWDLRKKKCFYTLPAHSNVISDVRYSPISGELLLTASFDGTLKVWNTRDYNIVRTLTGHSGKVMGCDISPKDEKHILSVGYDRTIKLWAHKGEF